jgi:hypothetical protein
MIRFVFPENLFPYTKNNNDYICHEDTLLNAIEQFQKNLPLAYEKIFNQSMELKQFVNLLINDKLVYNQKLKEILQMPVTEDLELKFIILFSGG